MPWRVMAIDKQSDTARWRQPGWQSRTAGEALRPGFSVVELLLVLALMAVLVMLSLTGLETLVRQGRSDASIKLLSKIIMMARETAISSGNRVTLCRSLNGIECGGSWSQGLILFVDKDGDLEVDSGGEVLHALAMGASGVQISWRSFRNRQYLQFTPLGTTYNQNGNFTVCPDDGDRRFARQLIINRAGRARLAVDSDGDGIVEDSRGRPVRC